jgi:hypothetical protein
VQSILQIKRWFVGLQVTNLKLFNIKSRRISINNNEFYSKFIVFPSNNFTSQSKRIKFDQIIYEQSNINLTTKNVSGDGPPTFLSTRQF